MALTVTIGGVGSRGNRKEIHGTFTTAVGDSTGNIDTGLTVIDQYHVGFEEGGLDTQNTKTAISNSTVNGRITITGNDFQGVSGKFWAIGA